MYLVLPCTSIVHLQIHWTLIYFWRTITYARTNQYYLLVIQLSLGHPGNRVNDRQLPIFLYMKHVSVIVLLKFTWIN
jgi:hypothetical protein